MMMHKAERKYEVGKVADEEEAKQRQLRAILNKLTYRNFRKLVYQIKAVNIDNSVTLYGVVSQIFDRALTEPLFCEMYANLSYRLVYMFPEFREDNTKVNFRRLLINLCLEQFEREEEEANKTDEEGGKKLSEEGREEIRVKERIRKLGNIRFMGELYVQKILFSKVMFYVMKALVSPYQFPDEEDHQLPDEEDVECNEEDYQLPDEEDVECLCILMSTIGDVIDHEPKGKEFMDVYFVKIVELSKNMKLSSRIRFMLEDVIDMRKNNWHPRRNKHMMMHKAERKYEVGKVADFEEAKQRQLRAILNKLTYQNFRKLVCQIKAVNICNSVTLYGFVSQIFDRALTEPLFCEMYAKLSYYLAYLLPEFTEDDTKVNFKRLLINLCQEQFEREKEEANQTDEEGGKKLSEEGREEKRVEERIQKLGNIRFMGELYKQEIFFTLRIMFHVMKLLLSPYQFPDEEDHQLPDEEDVECLCILMSTVGEMIDDEPEGKEFMDVYFVEIVELSKNMKLSFRIRFMLEDVIDMRENKWQARRKFEGPKQI